jgi:hypothetical protein
MHRATVLAFALAMLLCPRPAFAEVRRSAPPGGGLPALDVRVDLATASVDANGAKTGIPLDPARLPAEDDSTVEVVPIGHGKSVVHVRIPQKDDAGGVAWEAIFAGGRSQPIFAGLTGWTAGDPGERTGKALRIVAAGATHFVLVGDLREDLTLCGQSQTLLDPLALYPSSLALRPATVQRLSPEQQATAQRIVASPEGSTSADAPLAPLLVARGSSVPGSQGDELVDGDVHTVWSEKRPGQGQGEFVVLAASKDVPIARLRLVVGPPGARADAGASPRTFYLVTSEETFEVTLPEDAWLKPGSAYTIAFPRPIEASCLAVVLDSAYTRGAHPQVGIAELSAYSEFDLPGATLADVARQLSGDRAVAAAQVLERAGDRALAAVIGAYDRLDARGRALAMDVAAAHERCEEAAALLVRGLCDGAAGQAPRKAREKLGRCKGAAPVLAKSLRDEPRARGCVAATLATIAPAEALAPIADAMAAMHEEEHEARSELRSAFARALQGAPAGALAPLLGDAGRGPAVRLEILRAAEARVTEAPEDSERAVAALLRGAPPMRTRFLVLGPIARLARAGDRAAAARLRDAMTRDVDWPVRMRAAQACAGVADVQAALASAARDPEPRVREAALQTLATISPSPEAARAAKAVLIDDGWSFVRAQAVAVLAQAPASVEVDDALAGALRDPAGPVRGGAVVALARHRAVVWRDAIRGRLDDLLEDADVRALAASALGAVCDAGSVDRLTSLARALALPAASQDDQAVALGALAGLAGLQPRDLRERLAPLLTASAPPSVRAAAEETLATRGACR